MDDTPSCSWDQGGRVTLPLLRKGDEMLVRAKPVKRCQIPAGWESEQPLGGLQLTEVGEFVRLPCRATPFMPGTLRLLALLLFSDAAPSYLVHS